MRSSSLGSACLLLCHRTQSQCQLRQPRNFGFPNLLNKVFNFNRILTFFSSTAICHQELAISPLTIVYRNSFLSMSFSATSHLARRITISAAKHTACLLKSRTSHISSKKFLILSAVCFLLVKFQIPNSYYQLSSPRSISRLFVVKMHFAST